MTNLESFTGTQLRAAQALLEMPTQQELAELLGVSASTVQRWQAYRTEWVWMVEGYDSKIEGATRALERAGIQFLCNGGIGVFLETKRRRK